MAHWEFLETTEDEDEIFNVEGDTWQEALSLYLAGLAEYTFNRIRSIYRIESGSFKSCQTSIHDEADRRLAILREKEREREKAQRRSKWEELKKEFGE